MNEQRIAQLEREKLKIQEELKLLRGYGKLQLKNADKLTFPINFVGEVAVRYLSPSKIGDHK